VKIKEGDTAAGNFWKGDVVVGLGRKTMALTGGFKRQWKRERTRRARGVGQR
jgi:hypothetical protein